jgi:hypothetical protein
MRIFPISNVLVGRQYSRHVEWNGIGIFKEMKKNGDWRAANALNCTLQCRSADADYRMRANNKKQR